MGFEIKNLSIEKLELNEGQLYGLPKNPRWIRDARFKALKKSIEDAPEMLGIREIIVYPMLDIKGHEDKYIIIGGNMRYRACVELGYNELPCKIIPLETPVKKLREYVIKDNEGFGQNDFEILANDWDSTELSDFGMELDWVESSDNQWDPDENDAEGKDDEYDIDQSVEERVKRGEIWQLGKHRLMCGDSTNAEDVAKLMNGAQADLWITDPPYNVNYGGKVGSERSGIKNDSMSEDSFVQFLVDAFENAKNSMRPGAYFYVFHSDTHGLSFRNALVNVGLELRQCLIWKKDSICLGRQDYQWIHEPCLVGWKDGAAHSWYSDRKQTTVLEFDRPKKSELHPTMKPIPLFVYLLQNSSKNGDVVLDSFGGSGTTIMACEQSGRVGYSMELDEHYASVIVDRWEKYTGQKATKVEG